MSEIITRTTESVQEVNDSVNWFMKHFKIGELLRASNAKKVRGYSVTQIFTYIVSCMFSPVSTYMAMRTGKYKEEFSKNTIYRLYNDANINWHKFLRLLSEKVISTFIRPATSDERIEYFVIDDTPFQKSGKKTELVSKFFNHVTMKYNYGFRVLSLLWTDEYTSIPVDFCPLSSSDDSLLVCDAKKCDKRSIAGRIRTESRKKTPDVMMNMLRSAIKAGHKAKYVLFDSWFSSPKCIINIKNEFKLDVISMVKKSSKVFYEYNGAQCDVKKIYRKNRKRPGKSKYLLSVDVNLILKKNGEIIDRTPARIVYVRNKANRKDWIAIISTDVSISEEEIIRRYGVRWQVEVYFKTCKQYLKMLKECNSTSFDAYTCHLTIVAVRYMILSVYERSNNDDRTLGELFWMLAAEVEEIHLAQVLQILFDAMVETIREYFQISDDHIEQFVSIFISKLPNNLKSALLATVNTT